MTIANRTEELNKFLEMLEVGSSRRILLIEAPTGFGKSELLQRFEQICSDRSLSTVKISLESARRGTEYVLDRIIKRLGSDKFSRYESKKNEFQQWTSNINVSNNRLNKDNKIIINSDYKSIYENRLKELQSAFFEDLVAISQTTIILLDTFERAGESLRQWIKDEFLSVVVDNPNLFIVIAGQQVPTSYPIEWGSSCLRSELPPITDDEAWHSFFSSEELFPVPGCDESESRMLIKAYIHTSRGNPQEIRASIERLREWEV